MPVINLKEGSLPPVRNKKLERYAILDSLCARMEKRMGVRKGELKNGSQERLLSIGRDIVINNAWKNHEIPMSTIASYFGKTRQGIHAAIKREDETKKLRSLMYQTVRDEGEFEKHSEGRYHDPIRVNYED